MKKGFTLVELLAVIVILAVIALITIPAVMKMIDTSTTNSYRRSIDLYGKAISQGVISYESDMVEQNKPINITFENIDSYIEYEGNDVDCKDKKIYSDRTILLTECTVEEELVYGEKGRGYGEDNYYYYTNSKKKIKLIKYIEAVEDVIKDKNISGTCTIGEDKITCNGQDIGVKSKLENAIEGTLTIENNKVKSYNNLKFETEKKVIKQEEIPQVVDEAITEPDNYNQNNDNDQGNNTQSEQKICKSKTGSVSTELGSEYECEVKAGTKYNFYILSKEGDKVNLIMDRNICEDGSTNYTNENNYCRYDWNSGHYDNSYGPDTSMKKLYNATKTWINIPDMIMNYYDENNKSSQLNGYEAMITDKNTKQTTIITKQNKISEYQIFGSIENPLKARMPKEIEISNSGCLRFIDENRSPQSGTCPIWLIENMQYENVSIYEGSGYTDKYQMNNNNGVNQNIWGYWLLSSSPDTIYSATNVTYYGAISGCLVTEPDYYGIRPVITVPISYLTN